MTRRTPWGALLPPLVPAILVISVLEALVRGNVVPAFLVPAPSQIARALMTDPELLLLDEPAAGLDLGAREDLVTRLAAIAVDRWAPAQVLVTHHVEEIPAGFTHVLMLREGRMVAAGPIGETLTGRNLSEAFGTRLRSGHVRGRYWARAVPPTQEVRGRRGRVTVAEVAGDTADAADSEPDVAPAPAAEVDLRERTLRLPEISDTLVL